MRLFVTGGSGFLGTHVLRRATLDGIDWLNFDINAPVSGNGMDRWLRGDVLDADAIGREVKRIAPTHVLHLAARTDTTSSDMGAYAVNTVGTLNVLRAVVECESLQRFVFTSSQFVLKPGAEAKSDTDFEPHTTYGESKAIGELLTRAALPPSLWVIVRPTNVWGPWHPRYPTEFWSVLSRGLYFHPSGRATLRTYGYVGNVADQTWATLTLPADRVTGNVFYLGDPPINLRDWVDAFSRELCGRPVRTVPPKILRAAALLGDVATRLGFAAPLTSSRYRSMTEDYITPTEASTAALGTRGMGLEAGVRETVEWLRERAPR